MFSTLPKNLNGRDFIVTDVHGEYKNLMTLLEYVKFDESVDRLFVGGDLVDRGPESMECLRLLRKPWVYAVPGNHEDMTVQSVIPDEGTSPAATAFIRRIHFRNGGDWMWDDNGWGFNTRTWNPDIDPKELKELCLIARDLPFVITVEDSFSVMHAEPPRYNQLKVINDNADLLDYSQGNWALGECLGGPTTLWGRSWFYNFYDADPTEVKDQAIPYSSIIKTMYVGHTPVRQPLRLGFLVNLDTGACKSWGCMTIHCHTTDETYSLKDGNIVPNYIHTYERN